MFDIKGYEEANSLDELFQLMSKSPSPQLVAGGTDVMVNARSRDEKYMGATLIGITRIPELRGIELLSDGTLSIGATCTFTEIEKNALVQKTAYVLGQAVSTVGGPQTRNVGTIGGNVANGATSGDSGATLYAYNASIELRSEKGVRTLPVSEFYTGPGKVDMQDGEVLVRVLIKKEDYEGFKGYYTKFAQRKAMDIANLSCVTLFKEKDGKLEDLRISYGVAGPTPIRAKSGEALGKGLEITPENLEKIGQECLKDTKARDSWRASKEFREHLIVKLPGRNIRTARKGL